MDDRKHKDASAQQSAEQYQRYVLREQLRRREDSMSRHRQAATNQLFDRESRQVGVGAWRAERDKAGANVPEAMLVRWKQPSVALHQREAREQELEDRARRRRQGCQHHVVFNVKLISGVQLAVCSAQPGDSQAVLLLAIEEVNVRYESEPYRQSKHSKNDVFAQSDDFTSLFSKAVIPYSLSHKQPSGSSTPTSSSAPTSSSSASASSTVFSAAPREHIVISLTSLTLALPHDTQISSFLPTHPFESIKQQSRIGALTTATVTIDRGSPDIVLEADTFAVKYTAGMLGVFPHIFDLLIAIIPPQLLPGFTPPPLSPSYAAPPTPPEAPSLITASYPVPQIHLKCAVRNVTVDFPYTMDSDAIIEEPVVNVERTASARIVGRSTAQAHSAQASQPPVHLLVRRDLSVGAPAHLRLVARSQALVPAERDEPVHDHPARHHRRHQPHCHDAQVAVRHRQQRGGRVDAACLHRSVQAHQGHDRRLSQHEARPVRRGRTEARATAGK